MEFNVADLWEMVVDTIPDHEALVCGERRLTYAEADERANRLAHVLTERGIGVGDHVGLFLYNGTEYMEGMLAAFKIRAVPINVNFRYGEEELRYLLDDADTKAIIFHGSLESKLATVAPQLPHLSTFIVVDDGPRTNTVDAIEYEAALAAALPDRDFGPRSPDDLYILYTGGTTGMPKGVMWRQEDAFFAAFTSGDAGKITKPEQIADVVRDGTGVCLPASPFMHGTAHWVSFMAIFAGGAVIISPDRHLDPVRLWELVAKEGVKLLSIIGDAMGRPLVEAIDDLDPSVDLSGLRFILSGGAILSPTVKQAFMEKLPGTRILDGFGSSETGGQGQMIVAKDQAGDSNPRFNVFADTMVLTDDLRPAAVGEVGKLARRGRVPLGYYQDPEKSAATFPVIDGVRWSVPGDHARLEADGTITVLGRGSVSINTGGEKVYPEEVEAALKSHEDVFDAVVVGVPDERWGQKVVAVVQLREGATLDEDALQGHVKARLSGYKAPRGFVAVDAVVRSPSGKPDYRWAKETAERELETKVTATMDDAIRYRRLRVLNGSVGLIHLAQAAVVLALSNDLSLPVTASFLRADPVSVRAPTLPTEVFSVPIGPMVALFLLLAAFDHLLVAAPRVHRWYERNLGQRVNYARWIEYSVSASIMIVLIGLFVGIRDLAAVIALFAVNSAMILFGLLMERHQEPGRADWLPFWFGSMAGAVPWLVIAIYIAEPPTVPGFVWAITGLQLVLFASFALNMALQYRQVGPWRDYLFGERTYIVLSLVAKSLLAWLIFANVLRS